MGLRLRWCPWLLLIAASVSAQPLQPPAAQRYSYFSPGKGTVNLDNQKLEPRLFRLTGRALPTDVIVLTAVSRTLLRLTARGELLWRLNVAAGGGSSAMSSYRGRIIVGYNHEVLAVDPQTGKVEDRIVVLDEGATPINFLRVQNDMLIIGESEQGSPLTLARLSESQRGRLQISVLERISTFTQWPRDAVLIDNRTLAIADTFGHAVVFMERVGAGWRETRRMPEYFPNMLSELDDDGILTVLSEHGNRITRWNLRTGERTPVISCPDPMFNDPYTSPRQIISEEPRTATADPIPRQRCSVDVAGNQTLYAANGFAVEGEGILWVADSDNHRVAVFQDGVFRGAVTNINHPVRVIPVRQLGRPARERARSPGHPTQPRNQTPPALAKAPKP